jgi:hypothetical protein
LNVWNGLFFFARVEHEQKRKKENNVFCFHDSNNFEPKEEPLGT